MHLAIRGVSRTYPNGVRALRDVERGHPVIRAKLQPGRTLAHVYAGSSPGPGFEPAEPGLGDVYFSVMAGHQGTRAAAALLEAA